MRAPSSTFSRVGALALLFAVGCGSSEPAPAKDDVKATPGAGDKSAPAKAEPAKPIEPAKPVLDQPLGVPPVAITPKPGPGFTLGPAPATNAELAETLEPVTPLEKDGLKLLVGAQQTTAADESVKLALRARIELPNVAAPDGFNHERSVEPPEYGIERLELDTAELTKLPDGRWVVDAMLVLLNGEDVIVSRTEHSVILVDPTSQTASLLWSGADTGTSEFGACVKMSEHEFAVVGDELVVSKSDSVEWDAEAAAEFELNAEDCVAKEKTTVELARIKLAGA